MLVSVSHPSAPPFAQQVIRALYKASILDRFYTSLSFSQQQIEQSLWVRACGRLGIPLQQKLRNRTISCISNEQIRQYYLAECCRLAAGKLDHSGVWSDRVWEWSEHQFDRYVSKQLVPELDAIYGYEHAAEFTFERAKQIGVKTIYDVPAPETTQIRNLMEREISHYPEMDTLWFQKTKEREPNRLQRRKREWELADIVICASNFTKQTFATAGYDTHKVKVIPYGAPEPISESACESGGSSPNEKIAFIWAGTFSLRKGAHYLLEAWHQLKAGQHATLEIYGTCDLPASLLHPLPDGVHFKGTISQTELLEHYEAADALIFPTMYDGFGMVITEALSRGCPVITTHHAGAAHFITSGETGYIIESASSSAISEVISRCISKPDALKKMRVPAVQSAAKWQWQDYRSELLSYIESPSS